MSDTPERIWIDTVRHDRGHRLVAGGDSPHEGGGCAYLRLDVHEAALAAAERERDEALRRAERAERGSARRKELARAFHRESIAYRAERDALKAQVERLSSIPEVIETLANRSDESLRLMAGEMTRDECLIARAFLKTAASHARTIRYAALTEPKP